MSAPTITNPPTTFHEAQVVLKATLPGYEERAEQAALATAIETSWEDGSILIGQAGTGTGKSLGALIPAILDGKRTVYSTATKALQSQIMDKDLPFLAANLGVDFRYAMLQGRSNYFCHQKANENISHGPLVGETLELINADDDAHPNLDFELSGLREAMPIEMDNITWSKMTISADECPRKKCPFFLNCRFQMAKEKAAHANVVVANHALVALDGRIKEQSDGNANILGDVEHLVIDECHELEDYITSALTWTQTFATYKQFQSDVTSFFRQGPFEGMDADAINTSAMNLTAYADQFYNLFEIKRPAQSIRIRHGMAFENAGVVESMITAIIEMEEIFGSYQSDAENFEKRVLQNFVRLQSRMRNLKQALMDYLFKSDAEVVRLFEIEFRGSTQVKLLKIVPVRIGEWAQEWLWGVVPPTLISATVLVDGKADYIIDRLGLTGDISTLDVGSPFDFDLQSRLYIPAHIPDPSPANRARWEVEMMPLMEELVNISEGRALLLFTSRSQMDKAWDAFSSRIKHPCKKQGDLPNAHLTRWFREETNSVLFATRSFFTGIDIQGESLSLVIIDKLPFPVPTDPIVEARTEDIKRRGGNDFSEFTIPTMTLILQQAFGRLIRTKSDTGVVAIMDPRLSSKGYGTKILRSLPAPTCYDLNDVEKFFAAN